MQAKLLNVLKAVVLAILIVANQNCANPNESPEGSQKEIILCGQQTQSPNESQQQLRAKTSLRYSPSASDNIDPLDTTCTQLGGTPEIYTDFSGGSVAFCLMGTARVETLTLNKMSQGQSQQALAIFMQHPEFTGPSLCGGPAGPYCEQVGGRGEIFNSSSGQVGVCKFPDGSIIEQWTLFYGPDSDGNTGLRDLILGHN